MLKNPLIQEWQVDPLYQKAVELWVEYYNDCELFDELHCIGRGREGFALPTSPWERGVCTSHATLSFRRFMGLGLTLGLDDEVMDAAREEGLYLHEKNWPKGEPYSRIR